MEVFVSATEGNPGGVLVHVCQGVCSSCDECHEAIWTDGTVESGIDKGKKGH